MSSGGTTLDRHFAAAAAAALAGMRRGGGPFGAALVRGGELVCAVGNTVGIEGDPSGHAELVAVREGCRRLGTLDLSGCEMVATCEPCPMCAAVMLWAGIRRCHYASTRLDAAGHGFSDLHLRRWFDGTDTSTLELVRAAEGREACAEVWRALQAKGR